MRATSRLVIATFVAVLVSAVVPIGQGGGGRGGQVPGAGGGPARGQGPGQGGRGGLGPARDAASQTVIGTGSIAGVVTVEGAGSPVRRARVTLSGAELRGGRSVMTDEQGRFVFAALPAGRFTVSASKAGFVDNTYGAKRAGRPGTQIQLVDGQKIDRAAISLPRGSVITGIVVDDHGEPSAGTQVRALRFVMRTGERALQQAGQDTTDDRGVYRIYQLQPGDYIVNALPRNMAAGELRQTLATEISSAMQQLQSGRGAGAPVDLAALAGAAAGRGAEIGQRLAQLQEQLSVTQQEQSTAYAPVYYPGTTSATSAATVALGIGEERSNVDFQLQLVPTTRVGGLVVGPDGALPPGTQVALVPAARGALASIPGINTNMARVGADGRFSFNGVTPGQYLLQARATIRAVAPSPAPGTSTPALGGGGRLGGAGAIAQVLWASSPLDVGSSPPPDSVLNLQPGMTVSGRVEFSGSTTETAVDPTRVRVSLTPRGAQMFEIGGGAPPAQVNASGRFSIPGVAPGRYALTAVVGGGGAGQRGLGPAAQGGLGAGRAAGAGTGTTAQWQLTSAVVDGRDVLDFPIDIGPGQDLTNVALTFSDRTQELSGTISDASGRPTADFTIIVFTPDNRYWLPQARRIASTRPGTDGRFSFRGLPAGDYRLTAVTDVEPGEWYDPAFLTQLAAVSIPVTVGDGEKKVQDIRLAGGQ